MTWWQNLAGQEKRIYSQCGEDGVIEAIFANIGTTNRILVDIGAGDYFAYSNTRHLLQTGWTGELFDCAPHGHVHQERFNAENACELLAYYNVTREPDLLSIDIDGIDWYVLRAILRGGYRPRVIVAEFNCSLLAEPPVTVEYDPAFQHDGTSYCGCSLGAYRVMGEKHGYLLAHQCGLLNAVLIRKDCLPPEAVAGDLRAFVLTTHAADHLNRPWVEAIP
jgi:hypothetical protein